MTTYEANPCTPTEMPTLLQDPECGEAAGVYRDQEEISCGTGEREKRRSPKKGINTVCLPGDRYGRLTVLREAPMRTLPSGRCVRQVICVCDCGKEVVAQTCHLPSGHTKSCGCLASETATVIGKRNAIHGARKRTHGDERMYRTFCVWTAMRKRCNNPANEKYPDYGGRGIQICPEWDTFAGFFRDMGKAPKGFSLDRIDNNGGYSKANCRWATWREQAGNRRSSRIVSFNGEKICLTEAARRAGVDVQMLRYYIDQHGLSVAEAITKVKSQPHRQSVSVDVFNTDR